MQRCISRVTELWRLPSRELLVSAIPSLVPTLDSLDGLSDVQGNLAFWRGHVTDSGTARQVPKPADMFSKTGIPGVKHAIAVASGKGGVGKSTVAVNLAVAMAQNPGLKVGLVDADVYGPSIPTMLNLTNVEEPPVNEAGQMLPFENYGLRTMSMGFLMKANAAAVWRGPMAMKALDQLLFRTAWGGLDILVVDMPPGTGDVQITVAQRCKLSGAVVVSTPQEVALADARRGIAMFRKVNVPILGLVENMAYFRCGSCIEKQYIFGKDGAARVSKELSVEVIGQVPLEEATRQHADDGTPVVISRRDSEGAKVFQAVADAIIEELGVLPAAANRS